MLSYTEALWEISSMWLCHTNGRDIHVQVSADEVVLGTHECQLRQRITGQDWVPRRFISRAISQHGIFSVRVSIADTMQL